MQLTIRSRFCAVLFGAAAIALFSARSADAQVTYTNKVMGSNGRPQCLAVKDGRIANSSPLIIWDCVPGDPSQTFTFLGDGTLRVGAPGSQYCVAAYDGVQRGTRMGVWQCQPGHPTQTLSLGMYLDLFLVKSNPTLCLGVRDASRTPGATIIGWDCSKTGNDNQAWSAARAAAPAAAGNAPARVTAPVAVAPTPTPVASADPGMASAACQRMFGRDCSSDERSYLLRTTNSGPLYPTRDAMENYLRGYIANTPVIKDAVIMRASELTYGANRPLCTEALNALRSSFGTAWAGLYQLYYGVNGNPALIQSTVTSRCGANAAGAVGQKVDPAIAQAACQRIFGRNCSTDELADLTRTSNNAPVYPNRESMEARLADVIAASPAIKDTVIQSAFAFAMQGRQLCTEEMNDLRARFNRSPQAGNSWNGFYGLAYAANGQPALVQARASLCVAPAPAGLSSATISMIGTSYMLDLGRPATTQEMAYWTSQKPQDPRLASRAAFRNNNVAFIKATPSERQAMIQRAFAATWNTSLAANSKEMKYWDSVAASGQITYSDLKAMNDQIKALNPQYAPGQPLRAQLKAPASNYRLQSAEGSMIAAGFKPLADFFAALNGAVNTEINGAQRPAAPPSGPAPLGKPRMRIPNPGGVNGPFVIAATYHEQPEKAFCLDTGSWNAGSPVVAAPCHGGDSQLFDVNSANEIFMTNNPQGKLCLDGGDKPWPGDPRHKQLMLNRCNGSANQRWYVGVIPGIRAGWPNTDDDWNWERLGSGQIQNQGNGFCVDIEGGRTSSQSNPVIMYDCIPRQNGKPRPWNQVWGAGHFMTSGAAYIFMRLNSPPLAGHTGWGIQLADGSWEAGTYDSDEKGIIMGVVEKGEPNGAWRHHFATEDAMRQWFANGQVADAPNPPRRQAGYSQYMRWTLNNPVNSAAAFSLESQSWDWGYGVVGGNNCMDMTYKILKAYGWPGLRAPSSYPDLTDFAPKNWFKHVTEGTTPFWLPLPNM